jgi:hypothetical protein
MKNSNIIALNKQEEIDLLQSILKDGAQRMLAVAIESEVEGFIDKNRSLKTANDKAAIVRNGYLPESTIQTGLGDIAVKVPKVRDRSGSNLKFNSYRESSASWEDMLMDLIQRGLTVPPKLAIGDGAMGGFWNAVGKV